MGKNICGIETQKEALDVRLSGFCKHKNCEECKTHDTGLEEYLKCFDGFYVEFPDIGNIGCKPCPTGCSSCKKIFHPELNETTPDCLDCMDCYYYDNIFQSCNKCPISDCKTCANGNLESTRCQQCQNGCLCLSQLIVENVINYTITVILLKNALLLLIRII